MDALTELTDRARRSGHRLRIEQRGDATKVRWSFGRGRGRRELVVASSSGSLPALLACLLDSLPEER